MATTTGTINFTTWGQTIPYSYGARRLDGFKIWARGIESSDQTLDGIAYATWADSYGNALVPGEDVFINRIWFDGNIAWTLEGGVQMESLGTTLNFRFYNGTETQLPDPDIVQDKGATRTPAFRRQIYCIFFDVPLTAVGNRFPSTSVELLRTDGARINVSDVLSAVGEIGGINTVCEGIADQADGVIFQSLSPRSIFSDYKDQYAYRIIDGDPVRLVRRAVNDSLTIDATMDATDFVTARPDDDVVPVTRADDNAIANQIEITYNDKALNYQQGQQQFRRPLAPVSATTSHVIQRITTSFIITATEAIAICADLLYRLWARRVSLKFTLRPNWGVVEEADILSIPSSQGTFTVDVTRRTVQPDQSIQIESDVLQTVSGAHLLADTGSILASNLTACYVPNELFALNEHAIFANNGYLYAFSSCPRPTFTNYAGNVYPDQRSPYALARMSTQMPTRLSHSNVVDFAEYKNNPNGIFAQIGRCLVEDDNYYYAVCGDSSTGTELDNIIRVSKNDFSDRAILRTGQFLLGVGGEYQDMRSGGLGGAYSGPVPVVAGKYMLWLRDGTSSQPVRLYKLDLSNFDNPASPLSYVDLDLAPSGKVLWFNGSCAGDGLAFLVVIQAQAPTGFDFPSDPHTAPTSSKIYRYESWSDTVTSANVSQVLGHGVYTLGSAYFLPFTGWTNFYDLHDTNFVGVKVSSDLATVTPFSTRDDPNVFNVNTYAPWADSQYLYYVCNEHLNLDVLGEYTYAPTNYLTPYISRRSLADLSVTGGLDCSPFMDSGAYLLRQGISDGASQYVIASRILEVDTSAGTDHATLAKHTFGGNQQRGPSQVLQIQSSFASATVFPLIQPAASNDNFPGGLAVSVGTPVIYYNEFATKQIGEPNHCGDAGGRSLWWTFTAPETRYYQIAPSPIATGFSDDPDSHPAPDNIAVYSGVTLSLLHPELEAKRHIENGEIWNLEPSGGAFQDLMTRADWEYPDTSVLDDLRTARMHPFYGAVFQPVTFAAVTGAQFHIATDGFHSDVTNEALFNTYAFVVKPANLAPNDNFASADIMWVGSYLGGYNTRFATKEAGEPNHASNAGGKSIWFKFVAPQSGTVMVDAGDCNFATLLGVYTGTAVGSLTPVVSNDSATNPNLDDYTDWTVEFF